MENRKFKDVLKKLDPKDEFNHLLDHVKDGTFVSTYHKFLTRTQPNEIAARIERIADRLHSKITCFPSQHAILIHSSVTFVNPKQEEDVVIAVKQFISDDKDSKDNGENNQNANKNNPNKKIDQHPRYLVAFKRLKGSSLSYKKVVEEYYNAPEMIEIMDFTDIEDGWK